MTLHRPMFPPRADKSAFPKAFQIDRRGLLCALAAVPASAAMPSPAPLASPDTSPDTIFAAIDAFRSAATRYEEALNEIDAEEKWEANDRFYDQVLRPTRNHLISTAPTTMAGLAALLNFVREQGGVAEMMGGDDAATFERSLESSVCNIAGIPIPQLVGGGVDA